MAALASSCCLPRGAAVGGAPGTASYAKPLRVEYDVDVLVAGGGPAGFAAAVAAARAGKSVLLVESSGFFGGAATAALVPAFAPFGDGVNRLVGGIGWEVRTRLRPSVPEDAYWTPIDFEALKRVYDAMAVEAGVRFSFFTVLCDVVAENGHVKYVVLSTKRGLMAARARVYIDCTGDADLVAYAGGACEKGDAKGEMMPPTLCSIWADIDWTHIPDDMVLPGKSGERVGMRHQGDLKDRLRKAIADGVFTKPDYHLSGFFKQNGRASSIGNGNIGHVFGVDPLDERSLTEAMVDARSRLPEYERFYKEYMRGYERMRLVATGSQLGVRESRRVVCEYMLTADDFARRASFPDEIGRYCYPVDIHPQNADAETYRRFLEEFTRKYCYKKGESYGIPLRSLVPKGLDNVLVAGRCIGAAREMQASVRVMPCCFLTGEAAGREAARRIGVSRA